MTIIGDIAGIAGKYTLRYSITLVPGITVAVADANALVIEARSVFGTNSFVAKLCVRNTSIVKIFYISFDALADVISAGIWATLCVGFTVGVASTAGAGLASVTIAMITAITDAEFSCRRLYAVGIRSTGAGRSRALYALVCVTVVTFRTFAMS